jgi:hypothetical protein
MTAFDYLPGDEPLTEAPLFYVEPPDNRRDWPELSRQTTFLQLMRYAAPKVAVWATANAGKRNPMQARREGIKSGVLDIQCASDGPILAMIEFKGYDARGRAGKLSANQIQFGNRMHGYGVPVACFFSPHRAVDWLRENNFPIAEVRDAA